MAQRETQLPGRSPYLLALVHGASIGPAGCQGSLSPEVGGEQFGLPQPSPGVQREGQVRIGPFAQVPLPLLPGGKPLLAHSGQGWP